MKKIYYLMSFLMFMALGNLLQAQTYSLDDLSASDFEAGGNAQWSFEDYDVGAGTYTVFPLYGDSSKVNYYDKYIPCRFGSYPVMESSNEAYTIKRNAWFNNKTDFHYVARDYEVGTACYDLVYGTSIPEEYMGYETYSSPIYMGGVFHNSAITFMVPADGYYKVDMTVIRMDNLRTDPMTVFQRYRYAGVSEGNDVSLIVDQSFTYGAGGDDNPPVAPETGGDKTPRCNKQELTSGYFYIYAKAGDKISFEADARSTNNPENAIRGNYGRTKWTNLALTVTDETTAKSETGKFVDPYAANSEALTQLSDLMDQTDQLIANHTSEYSESALQDLQDIYTEIDNNWDALTTHPLGIPAYIDDLQAAIDTYVASYGVSDPELKVRYIFNDVADNTVPDVSGKGNEGTLVNNASIVKFGDFNVMDLGTGNGYLDMGAGLGSVISTMDDYTISTYYRVAEDAPLSGNGFMLWAFSTQEANSSGSGQYIFYRMTDQSYQISPAGWNNAKAVTVGQATAKGAWKHVVYVQSGGTGTIYVDGVEMASGAMPPASDTITQSTPYNWIGRPPFSGDNYLQQTYVYDFRLYNYAITINQDSVNTWSSTLSDLEYATNFGNGDYTDLNALIAECTDFKNNATPGENEGEYPQVAIDAFTFAIDSAQEIVDEGNASQLRINATITYLQTAYDSFKNAAVVIANGDYYIKIGGDYYLNNPGIDVLANGVNLTATNEGLETNINIVDQSQIFFVAKLSGVDRTTVIERYSFFSTLEEIIDGSPVYRHFTENAIYQQAWGSWDGGSDDEWRTMNILKNETAYAIQNDGKSANKGYWYFDAANTKLVVSGSTAAYDFDFITIPEAFDQEVPKGRVALDAAVVGTANNEYSQEVYDAFKTALETAEAISAGTATKSDLFAYGAAREEFKTNGQITAVKDVVNENIFITSGKNYIRVISNDNNAVNVTVYSLSGVVVSRSTITNDQTIDVNPGLYLVKVSGKTTKVSKVIVW